MTRVVVYLASLLALAAGGADSPGGELEVGVAEVEITPPRGYRMAGYFGERVNTGTRDPLWAKALVFRQGGQTAALVFCDLIAVSKKVAGRARDEASRKTGIPAAHIAVAATHSHTGPLYDGVLRSKFHERAVAAKGTDEMEAVDYPARLVDGVAGAVRLALERAKPARIDAGTARVSDLSFNRRFLMKDGAVRFNPGVLNPDVVRPAGPIDPEVGLLVVRPAGGGKPTAGLTVFALHLDTVGGTQYSADYPYFLEDELRKEFGPGYLSVFGAGTCGDVNHIDVSRRDRVTADTIGRSLARAVLRQVPSLAPLEGPGLAVARGEVEVGLQRCSAAEVAEARKVLATFEESKTPFLETVRVVKVVDLADNYPAPAETFEVQVFRLGAEVAVVTLPGEVFVEHGLAIKKASPFKTTLVVELANACPAYVPTLRAFEEGSYEVVNSRVAPGGGEKLVAAAVELLKAAKGGSRR